MYGDDADSEVYELMPQVADHYHFDTGKEKWSDIRQLGLSPTTDALGGGHAHCGMMIYQADQWPRAYRNKLLTLNLHGRRINVERLDRQGAGYVGRHEPDLARFADPWFRGIELSAGPDGSVWILDWSDIGECHENDGVHRNSGTIYRLSYGTNASNKPTKDLRSNDESALLDSSASNNAWVARQSRLILSERAAAGKLSPAAADQLESRLFSSADENQRLAALWTLAHCGLDSQAILLKCLRDSSEHVRVQALQLLSDPSKETRDVTPELLEMIRSESSDLVMLHTCSAMQKLRGAQWWSIMALLCQRTTLVADRDYPLMLWYAFKSQAVVEPNQAIDALLQLDNREVRNATSISDQSPSTSMCPPARLRQYPLIASSDSRLDFWPRVACAILNR